MTHSVSRRIALLLLSSCCLYAPAAKGPAPVYQDGILVSFSTAHSGETCRTSGTTTASATGDRTSTASSDGSASCSDVTSRNYTLKVGDFQFVVKPAMSKKDYAVSYATIGWGSLFLKNEVLAGLLPGTHVSVRTDDQGLHVKVGKRESLYTVVAAQ